jgi:hypothetical protein
LSYPFAWQVSPFAAEVDEACYLSGERMGIFCLGDPREYRDTQVDWLAAYTCPLGTREGLQLPADWQMWLFAFDEGYCDESDHGARPGAVISRVVELLSILEDQAGPAAADPFGVALDDLAGCAHGFQRSRFISAMRGYFLAQCWEAVNGEAGIPPGLGEYTRIRRHGGTTAQPRAHYAPDGTPDQAVIVFFSQMARDPHLRAFHDVYLREDVGLG